jgi:hypothetical protein
MKKQTKGEKTPVPPAQPVAESKKKTTQGSSGSPDSRGGSREGNIGHEKTTPVSRGGMDE